MLLEKRPTPLLVLTSLLLALPSVGQTTYTQVAGYVKLQAAAAASASEPTYSFVTHSLAQKRKAAGVVTAGGTDSITASASTWGTDDYAGSNGPHFIVMIDGAQEGNIFDVVSNTADTLTLAVGSGDMSSLVGDSFRIYQHNTLASVFGADPTANGFQGGLDANTADHVIFYDGTSFSAFFYKNENIPDFLNPNDIIGWVSTNDNETDVSDKTLPPNKGFIVMRRDTGSDFEVPVFGDVIDNSINVPIVEGYNLVNVPYPIDGAVTLASSGLYDAGDPTFLNSLEPGLDANTAELVVTWNGTSYIQYFYKDENIPDFLNPNDIIGWVTSNDNETDVGSTALDDSFFILRKSPNPPLDWVFPSVLP